VNAFTFHLVCYVFIHVEMILFGAMPCAFPRPAIPSSAITYHLFEQTTRIFPMPAQSRHHQPQQQQPQHDKMVSLFHVCWGGAAEASKEPLVAAPSWTGVR
jgi:hypothetical protein